MNPISHTMASCFVELPVVKQHSLCAAQRSEHAPEAASAGMITTVGYGFARAAWRRRRHCTSPAGRTARSLRARRATRPRRGLRAVPRAAHVQAEILQVAVSSITLWFIRVGKTRPPSVGTFSDGIFAERFRSIRFGSASRGAGRSACRWGIAGWAGGRSVPPRVAAHTCGTVVLVPDELALHARDHILRPPSPRPPRQPSTPPAARRLARSRRRSRNAFPRAARRRRRARRSRRPARSWRGT